MGQEFPLLKFTKITVREGLSSNQVRALLEDSRGLIWIGTINGLNRYSATGIKVYKRNENALQTSLASSYINGIAEAKNGPLWVATSRGLSRFDPATGISKNFSTAEGLISPFVAGLVIDAAGNIVLITDRGVQKFLVHEEKFITYSVPDYKGTGPITEYNNFRSLAKDKQGNIWVFSRVGPYLIDDKGKRLIYYYSNYFSTISGLYENEAGDLVLSTWGSGLLKIDLQQKAVTTVAGYDSLGKVVSSFQRWTDTRGQDWLCFGHSGGITLQSPTSGAMKKYGYVKDDPYSLDANNVFKILKDRRGRLWLSSDNGVSILDPAMQNFDNIPLYKYAGMSKEDEFGTVFQYAKTPANYYISSFPSKGMYALDTSFGIEYHLPKAPPQSGSPMSKAIHFIFPDNSGNLWLGTDSGLVKKTGNTYKVFLPYEESSVLDEELVMHRMQADATGNFWIRGRKKSGLFVFDPKTEKFIKHYPVGKNGLDPSAVLNLAFSQNQNLIVCTDSALYLFDPAEEQFKPIKVKKQNGEAADAGLISDISKSTNDNTLWGASRQSGLLKIYPEKLLALQVLDQSNTHYILYNVKQDNKGIVWASSEVGLLRYDPTTKNVSQYSYHTGLPFLFKNDGFLDFDNRGNLLMSNSGTLTKFNPYFFRQNNQADNVVILDVEANGKQIAARDTLNLPAGSKDVNINFAITNYTAPELNKYYYKLNGQQNWQEVTNGNAYFANLSHGEYKLILKGTNNEGKETIQKVIQLRIQPFWYETLLAKLLLALALASIIYLVVRARIKSIRKEAGMKHKIAEMEMQAVRSQLNPHFIFNALNSIELYTVENKPELASLYLSKFSKLMRLVLDNSKKDFITLDQEVQTLRLYLELEKLRFKEKMDFSIEVEESIDGDYIEIPPMLIQPYVENAIWHGLMHKPGGGIIHLRFKEDLQKENLIIEIEDNGIGREKAAELKKNNAVKRKSFGMQLNETRLQALKIVNGIDASVNIIDKTENQVAGGTLVILKIQLK